MNKYERTYRLSLEIVALFLFIYTLHKLFSLGFLLSFIFSFLFVHTLFWVFNGHFFVLMRYLTNWKNDPNKFLTYINNLQKRIENKKFILAAAIFGSISRGNFSTSSDLDVRLIRKKDLLNTIRVLNYCTIERVRAFFHRFPLDIYVFDLEELSKKINPKEPALILSDPKGVLKKYYGKNTKEFSLFYSVWKKR